jgi:hypothetical protein
MTENARGRAMWSIEYRFNMIVLKVVQRERSARPEMLDAAALLGILLQNLADQV